MSDAARFQGSIPQFYDRCLVPFLFIPYADDLVRRVPATPGARVLEIACGTGVVTHRLRAALPDTVEIVATDLNPGMIEVARANLSGANVHWRTADAAELPFKDAAFDAVVVQFGYMFLPDKAKGLSEARRVLKPGGHLLASAWRSLDENPAAKIAHETAAALAPQDPPQFLKTPYGPLGDAELLRSLAAGAGFAQVAVERVALEGKSPSARDVAEGFMKGTPLSLELTARGIDLDAASDALEPRLALHGGHPFRSPLAANVLTAA